MIGNGLVLILGLTFLLMKLPRRKALQLLGHHLWLDVGTVVLMTIVHFGTFSGLMAAAVAGMMCSLFTWTARWLFGYIERGKYHPGKIPVKL
jgi:hypothetical protein